MELTLWDGAESGAGQQRLDRLSGVEDKCELSILAPAVGVSPSATR